jgi:hypothetical protein
MKIRNYLKLSLIVGLLGVISSCQKDETELIDNQVEKDCSADFNGLKVNHNYNAPLEALYYEKEDLQTLYLSKLGGGLKSANLEELEYPSLEEMAAVEDENLKQYPDFDEMADEDIEWIKRDFPTLTEQEIAENIEAISEYYIKNLQYDLIIDLTENRNSLKSASYYGGTTCSKEFWFLVLKPKAAIQIKKAREDAEKYTIELYGDNLGGDKSDAFRHIIWNTLIAKYYGGKKKSISKGVDMAKTFTDIHEDCNSGDGQEEYDQEMDYHNNWIGRDHFQRIASIKTKRRRFWFKKKWLVCPDNSTIKTAIKAKVDNAKKVSKDVASIKAIGKYIPVYYN